MTQGEADRAFLDLLNNFGETGESAIVTTDGILTKEVLEESIKAYKRRYPDPAPLTKETKCCE